MGIAVALVCLVAIAGADGVRTALLAAVAGGAILLTRIRFAAIGALTVLVLTGLVVLTGAGVGD